MAFVVQAIHLESVTMREFVKERVLVYLEFSPVFAKFDKKN